MHRSYVTLSEVAEAAGVSRSQASRALRGDPGVREEVRERVQEKALELGYHVNVAARQLASGRATGVGVVVGEPMNPYHMMMATEISDALVRKDLDPMISLGRAGVEVTPDQVEPLLRHRVGALILIGSPRDPQAVAEIGRRIPVVYIGEDLTGLGLRCVIGDDETGARMATEHLIAKGHREIAHISGGDGAGARGRAEGYAAAMRDAGLEPVIQRGWFDLDGGQAGADALMARRTRPTAIFAANDRIAMGAMNRLLHLGYRVPEDVAVIGYDDAIDSGSETVSLTSVRQSSSLFGEFSAGLVAEMLSRRDGPLLKVVPVELIVRRSSDFVRTA